MAHPIHHSISSARRWGGEPSEYTHLHDWFDESKAFMADFRHRALRHHAEGIFQLEKVFGPTLKLSTGREIPTRWVGEQHVREDCGRIPSMQDWFSKIVPEKWMGEPPIKLSRELEATKEPIIIEEIVKKKESNEKLEKDCNWELKPNAVMDVGFSLFNSHVNGAKDKAKIAFIKMFGRDAWDKHLEPYVPGVMQILQDQPNEYTKFYLTAVHIFVNEDRWHPDLEEKQ